MAFLFYSPPSHFAFFPTCDRAPQESQWEYHPLFLWLPCDIRNRGYRNRLLFSFPYWLCIRIAAKYCSPAFPEQPGRNHGGLGKRLKKTGMTRYVPVHILASHMSPCLLYAVSEPPWQDPRQDACSFVKLYRQRVPRNLYDNCHMMKAPFNGRDGIKASPLVLYSHFNSSSVAKVSIYYSPPCKSRLT